MQHALYIDGRKGQLDPEDRGLAYGDGLFETMAARDRHVRWLDLHLERLVEGCHRLAIPVPDLVELRARIHDCAPAAGRATIKLILSRGSGPRGYAPPDDPTLTIVLFAYADGSASPAPGGLEIATLRARTGENPKLAGIKHLCRLEQVLARLELKGRGADEGLMLGLDGRVVGGTSTNVFACFGSELRTPRITGAGVCGVMRRVVLERCAEHGLTSAEVDLTPDELYAADEVFVTNALIGIRHVTKLDEHLYAERSVADGLCESLGIEVHA